MDKEDLQEKIALFYSRLPQNLQEKFSSMQWLETLKNISAEHKLSDQQIETLGTETMLVLLSVIHLDEYEYNLKEELGLPKEDLDKLLAEINSGVLSTIRPELTETFEKNYEDSQYEPDVEPTLDARFDRLPPETQKILVDSNYQNTLYNIGKEYMFNIEQIGNLEKTTTNLIVGAIRPEKFADTLEKALNLPTETTSRLVSDINQKILKLIREKMMKLPGSNASMHDDILSSAGIEIIDQNNTKKTPQIPLPDLEKLEITGKVQEVKSEVKPEAKKEETKQPEVKKPETPSILAQKIANSFKSESIKTEYSLHNLSKAKGIEENSPQVPKPPSAYPPKGDPYRLSPDE